MSEIDIEMVRDLALAEEISEPSKCRIEDGRIIIPCADLGNALEESEYVVIAQLNEKIDVVILEDTGMIFSYCPFCASKIFEEGKL